MVENTKSTLIIGASTNHNRFSYKAIQRLVQNNIHTFAISEKEGEIFGVKFQNQIHFSHKIHTVSFYLRPSLQSQYSDTILKLLPSRIIFNPGTENIKMFEYFNSKGIFCENACTLVLLSTNQY
tara:strand:+ start:28788 stop:29159 length:372 start_codon:yes stop_codon:yes gene_type:complete